MLRLCQNHWWRMFPIYNFLERSSNTSSFLRQWICTNEEFCIDRAAYTLSNFILRTCCRRTLDPGGIYATKFDITAPYKNTGEVCKMKWQKVIETFQKMKGMLGNSVQPWALPASAIFVFGWRWISLQASEWRKNHKQNKYLTTHNLRHQWNTINDWEWNQIVAILASFLLAALSSVLKRKGVNEFGDCNLFLQALKNFEQLAWKNNNQDLEVLLKQEAYAIFSNSQDNCL